MSWQDRIREAAYTSPGGVRVTFTYEDVRENVDKKTAAFNFPDAEGTYVQDLGHTGRRYPLRIFFHGDDYDLEATSFLDILLEKGFGTLEHPAYGSKTVIPFGVVSRRDDLKTASNQAIFDVVFWETIEIAYPLTQADPGSQIINSVDEYNTATADQFVNDTDLSSVVNQQNIKGPFQSALDSTKSGLNTIANTQANVTRQFNNIYNSINSNIDTLVGQPLTLIAQTVQLIQSPARALTSIQARLEAYGNLANNLITTGGVATPGVTPEEVNNFQVSYVYASGYVTGQVLSVVNNEFTTRVEALSAAEEVLSLFESVNDWKDLNIDSLGIIDTGESYQKLQEAVAFTIGFLIQISFTLKQERKITLDRERSIIDLAAELYSQIDEVLDFFISSNGFTGSEIINGIPEGREIVYYI